MYLGQKIGDLKESKGMNEEKVKKTIKTKKGKRKKGKEKKSFKKNLRKEKEETSNKCNREKKGQDLRSTAIIW